MGRRIAAAINTRLCYNAVLCLKHVQTMSVAVQQCLAVRVVRLSCIVIALLCIVGVFDFIQFIIIFIRAIFGAAFRLSVVSGL